MSMNSDNGKEKGKEVFDDKLRKFALIARVGLLRESADGAIESLGHIPDDHPVLFCAALRESLRSHADSQDDPFLMRDSFDVCFASIKAGQVYYYIGPMSLQKQGAITERQFYRSYGIQAQEYTPLRFFTKQEIIAIVQIFAEAMTGRPCNGTELLYARQIEDSKPDSLQREQTLFLLEEEDQDEDDETWRHTYREEQNLMSAVREGRVEDALRLSQLMDDDNGRLSSHEINHWRNLAIVGIALVSRAAIEGGLSPQSAYRISGYYISKCDAQTSAAQILSMRDYAIRDLTTRVRQKQEQKHTSNYTESCKTYISRHYREKIYLEEIAEQLGISPSYLSRLFRKDTGISLQDYIVRIRVERAANLLRYSDRSLSDIAHYVNFPSQSYLGKMFLREMHMTPKEYRDRYRTAEWQ